MMYLALVALILGLIRSLASWMLNKPIETLLHFEIWRIFTNIFVGGSLFGSLFALLWINQSCRFLETELGL